MMAPGIFKIVFQTIRFYKKPIIYQILIIALLSAVITGSLLTGKSVRTSLKKSASERLGNTGIMISSGVRFFDSSLAERLKDSSKINSAGILEINGYSQSLKSQKGAFNTHIYAINQDFFKFHGNDSIVISTGEVAVNIKLANYLDISEGDELIIRFNELSDIPADAPFAPVKDAGGSFVIRVGNILNPQNTGNFSLSISQITPMNIFINLSDLEDIIGKALKINRLLIENSNSNSLNEVYSSLKNILKPSDIGLDIRMLKRAGKNELISDRVFIDETIVKEIESIIPSSAPVITYLGNRFKAGKKATPYSFVSALPSDIYPDIPKGDGMIINSWLAKDLAVKVGDSVEMFWYSPDLLNKLLESSSKFVVDSIVDMQGIWSDSLLMPDFPGISGSESCSEWDAGVPVKMDEIRGKDEDYWNKYKGTPKAFINYDTGKKIWGNNFGPATALLFPEGISEKEIEEKLIGSLDPDKVGFTVTDLSDEAIKAANQSVDFSTLFLSLGFFLILASIVLLSFAVSSYFDSKKDQISIFFALGFKTKWIEQLLFLESGLLTFAGCLIGSFTGYLVNILITKALNSVWSGAVQTDTLEAFFNIIPILIGFIMTILTTGILMIVKIKRYLNKLNRQEKEIYESHSPFRNFIFLITTSIISLILFAFSIILKDQELTFSFAAGTVLLIALILSWRQYFIGPIGRNRYIMKGRNGLSKLYYSFYPSNGVTPILFIAAGIFAVFITGANRMNFNGMHQNRSSGTGGYLLWCENTIPVKEDLNTIAGRKATGLDDEQLMNMSFVQAKRSSGNDASCLNLNHITAPPLLGIDPVDFISKRSFSFSHSISVGNVENPWQFLDIDAGRNTIYGFADQTVLDWGLMIKPGDTLVLRTETGQPLNIIIAAGLKSSVFQGNVLIGRDNFMRYYPSVPGNSVLLVDGDPDDIELYKSTLNERLGNFGINIESTNERLASFHEVTNTYLTVFGVFGVFGMIIGIVGLGFVLLRNYNHRKREFALMLATGYSVKKIRRLILSEQMLILFAGVFSGVFSATIATLPSLKGNPEIPWLFLIMMVLAITITGLVALILSAGAVSQDSLIASLKKE
ncbi:MAG TPA: FtsX-like permease family protein [Bacteroidales bacterium]|nr:FtsX-like permease family protein [Bacteroidales bacterium]